MKVLQVAYKSDVTGGEVVLLQLAAGLVAAGHELHALCPSQGALTARLRDLGATTHVMAMRKTYDVFAARRIAQLLRTHGIDLVHTHGMLVNVLGRLACRLHGRCASVSTVHLTRDLAGRPMSGSFLDLLKGRYYYRPLDNWTARWNDRVIAVSQAVRADLVAQGCDQSRLLVIPNGIDPAPFDAVTEDAAASVRRELGLEQDAFLLGVVARLSPQKDVATFIDAFARIANKIPTLSAFVAGTGPLEGALRGQLAATGLSERIRLLGHRRDVPALLRACDLFVLSSRWEGLPLSVLEAMASRKAVVATRVPGTVEAVDDGKSGLIVPIGSAEGMADAIAALTEDRARCEALGEAGRRKLDEHFHVRRVVEQHLALYEKLVGDIAR